MGYAQNFIYIYTDSGRVIRPLYVKNNKLNISNDKEKKLDYI